MRFQHLESKWIVDGEKQLMPWNWQSLVPNRKQGHQALYHKIFPRPKGVQLTDSCRSSIKSSNDSGGISLIFTLSPTFLHCFQQSHLSSVSTNKGAAKAKVLPATDTGITEAASWSTSSLLTTVMAPLGATLEEIIRHNEVTHKPTQEAKICFNLQKKGGKGGNGD